MTFGRCHAWANDSSPIQANTSMNSSYDVWYNMIGGKRVTGNDIRHCIPRVDWEANTVYNMYDDMTDSKSLSNFYVLTDDYHVYKCISNNYGVVSNTKPTSTSAYTDVQMADGYIWKFIYKITEEEKLRFMTDDYIPVKTVLTRDTSLQWFVQNNAISGAIHNILLTDFGSNYTANDMYVTITGDGLNANAFATRNVSTNTISSIIIDQKGTGYTFANVTIFSATGNGAAGRAIISPPGGHGSDPLVELGGSNLIIHTQLKNTEGNKLSVANDFRQLALIKDPLVYDSANLISNTVISQLTVLNLTGTSAEYIEDENVYQGASIESYTFKGKVVEWDTSNNIIKLSNVTGTPTSALVIGETSSASRFVSSITYPDLEPFVGNVLYVNNISPIERASDQTEDFKIILSF